MLGSLERSGWVSKKLSMIISVVVLESGLGLDTGLKITFSLTN